MAADRPAWYDQGAQMTQEYEGFRPTPYKDTQGIPTIGYGFNMQAYPNMPKQMTQAQAAQLFQVPYLQAINKAQSYAGPVWQYLPPNQQMILSDMAYNLGDRLYGFKDMRKALQDYDVEGVKREMRNSKWFQQTGRRAKAHVMNWDWQPVKE
jgi:lysozyme